MKIRAALAATAAAAVSAIALASPASAGVVPQSSYAPYWRLQSTGTCVEWSALDAMSALKGGWVASTAGIDAEAIKLGILNASGNGSTFDANNDALFTHYGFKATAPKSTSRATVSADLAKGDAVQVTVYGGYVWPLFPQPEGTYEDPNTSVSADHAVIVESIAANGNVTLGDTGVPFGNGEVLTWAQFSKAWGVGGYQAIVISK